MASTLEDLAAGRSPVHAQLRPGSRTTSCRPVPGPLMSTRQICVQARAQLIDQTREIIKQRLHDPDLTLSQIARELCISSRHLQRAFVEAGSPGFRLELSRSRVRRAVGLWQSNPDLTVAQVARAVGHRRPHQFAKVFRMTTGQTPSSFRARCRQTQRSELEL